MRKSFEKFLARQEALARQYGEAYEEKQHNRGKLTARERIEFLFDEGTFEEVDAYSPSATTSFGKTVRSYGDGVITGFGNINGRQVFAYSQDFNVQGGSLGSVHAAKIIKARQNRRGRARQGSGTSKNGAIRPACTIRAGTRRDRPSRQGRARRLAAAGVPACRSDP